MPETRPQASKNSTSAGSYINIGYGFSNKFNLNLSAWTDLKLNYNVNRSGYALQSRICFGKDSSKHFEIIPRIALLFYEKTQSGCGMEIAFVYMNNMSNKCLVYFGAGPAAGTMDFKRGSDTYNQNLVYPCGFGVIGHFGVGFNIMPRLRTVIEINPIYEFNQYDGQSNYLIAPSITAGYVFR